MGSANERRCYNVTSSFIGWAYPQNESWYWEGSVHKQACLILRIGHACRWTSPSHCYGLPPVTILGPLLLIRFNTLRPRQNGRHFADDIFKCIFFNENVSIAIKISLKFVPKGPINNIPALVQIMAWRRPGDKLLSEPVVVSLLTHICITRPQWVNFKGSMDK